MHALIPPYLSALCKRGLGFYVYSPADLPMPLFRKHASHLGADVVVTAILMNIDRLRGPDI